MNSVDKQTIMGIIKGKVESAYRFIVRITMRALQILLSLLTKVDSSTVYKIDPYLDMCTR